MKFISLPILILSIILLHTILLNTAEANIGEKIVSSTAKTMVKTYVALINLEKTKNKLINKLEKIDYNEYKIRYAKLYNVIKDLPPQIKSTYNITPGMSKAQMAKNIQSVDKKELYKIINSIPDKAVTELFKKYLKLK